VAQLERDRTDLYGLVRVLEDDSADNATKANAARKLRNIGAASNADPMAVAAEAAGAIPLLVELLRGGSENCRVMATAALWNLALWSHANKAAIMAAGAFPPLVELLRDGSSPSRANATLALKNLAAHDASGAAVVAAGALPLLVELLRGGSDVDRENAAGALANLANGSAAQKGGCRGGGRNVSPHCRRCCSAAQTSQTVRSRGTGEPPVR
jgi:vacuolar protein 8